MEETYLMPTSRQIEDRAGGAGVDDEEDALGEGPPAAAGAFAEVETVDDEEAYRAHEGMSGAALVARRRRGFVA